MSFAAVAAVASAAFAVVVGRRFRRSRRPAFAAWALGLVIFAVAAAVQAAGEAQGFTPLLFRLFYLLGGVLGVAYLALGTLFLLAPGRIAWASAAVLVATTLASSVDAFLVPVDATRLTSSAGVLGDAFRDKSTLLHLAAVLLNVAGTVVLVGGSGWSAWRFARDRSGGFDRVLCNVLLTTGAFIIAAGFSAGKVRGGSLSTLGAFEFLGITTMFAGFLSLGRVGSPRPATLGSPAVLPSRHS